MIGRNKNQCSDTQAMIVDPAFRERDDLYIKVIVRPSIRWRVILCAQGLQWIIQKRSTKRPNRGVFIGKSFHTTRKSLLEACSTLQLLDSPRILASLLDLPERPNDSVNN